MTEFINDELAEIQDSPFLTPSAEFEEWVETYGNEAKALDVALAKIQELSSWVVAQEHCPDCFGETVFIDDAAECLDCGSRWSNIGKKLPAWGKPEAED